MHRNIARSVPICKPSAKFRTLDAKSCLSEVVPETSSVSLLRALFRMQPSCSKGILKYAVDNKKKTERDPQDKRTIHALGSKRHESSAHYHTSQTPPRCPRSQPRKRLSLLRPLNCRPTSSARPFSSVSFASHSPTNDAPTKTCSAGLGRQQQQVGEVKRSRRSPL